MRYLTIPVLLLFPYAAVAQEEPPVLYDLAKLGLHVVTTETVEELRTVDIAGETLITPPQDNVLAVVTLEGRIDEPWRIALAVGSFAATYETTDFADENEALRVEIRHSVGLSLPLGEHEQWLLRPERGDIQTTRYFREPGTVTIRAAFIVPANADSFTVLIPTVAEGQAELPEAGA